MFKTMVSSDLQMKNSKIPQISNYSQDEKRPFSIAEKKLNTL
jgi:hypothetical protein